MSDNLAVFSSVPFREIVQDLRELLSHRRVAFLLGAGCSHERTRGLPIRGEQEKAARRRTVQGEPRQR
jgi:hypothetical protein